MELRSKAFDVTDVAQACELCYERGWTDGLPVIPPTEAKVVEMLEYLGRDPQEVIGTIPPKNGIATLEKIAINCVMAGCLPKYLPVVLAAFEAMFEGQFNLNGVEATQHPCEPLLIVGGPIVKELSFNYGDGVFGGGSRANATIGRAVRLILWNIGGSVPGEIAKSPLSQPGRYSYCIAENQDASPWEPLHVEKGLPAEASAVTVIACTAPFPLHLAGPDGPIESAQRLLILVGDSMASMGSNQMLYLPDALLVFGSRAAEDLARRGFSKAEVQRFLFEKARRRLADLATGHYNWESGNTRWPKWIDQTSPETLVPCVPRPESIHIVVSGGPAGAAWCPGWHFSWPQTKAITFPQKR